MAAEGNDSKRPVKPNRDEFNKELERMSKEIAELRHQLDVVQGKIPQKDAKNPTQVAKNEAKKIFDTLLKEKQALVQKKKALFDQLKQLQQTLKKKTEETKNAKDKIGYKTTGEVDNEINKLEQQLQSGGIPLIEEKRIVAEISTLKKTKKQLETLNQPGAIDAEKQKLDEIKPLIKTYDEQIAKLDVQLTEAKTTMTKHEQELSATRDSLNDLFTQKKDLSAKLNAAKDAKNQFYKEFKAAQDAWYAYEREQYRLREEQRKLEQKQQRDAKMLAQAEYELEAAEVPAYGEELALCAAIVKVLKNLTGEKDETPAPAPATPAGRQVDEKDSMPKGGSLLVSKRDKDDDFIVLGNKKSKKQSKKQAQVELNKPVKLDIEMIDQFGRLKIDMPRTFAEIPNTIAALDAKSKEFLKNQATQTKANKEAALAKLNKIKEQLAAQDTEGFQTAE